MDAILQVENLTKQYPGFTLDHVSFSVPKGTIMGLIGENGAGKSTTVNAILDLINKDDGTVAFWGQELSSSKQLKENIGVVFDGFNFYETLTKRSKLDFSLVKPYVKTICFTMIIPVIFAAINRSLLTKISFAMCFIAMTTGYTFSITEKTLWNGFMVFYQSQKATWLLGDIFLSFSWA